MSLEKAAESLGIPEALVQRSAVARSAETGQSVDRILAAWAGNGLPVATPPRPAEAAGVDAEFDTPAEEQAPTPSTQIVIPPEPIVSKATARAPVPLTVTPAEAVLLREVIAVPTAGIKERMDFVTPKWLTAVMLIIPLFAIFALGDASTGTCGEATELATDVVTGEIVNCDGSEFSGSQIGGGGLNYIALGGDIYNSTAVIGVNCAWCHGANGQGSGAFPPLTGVATTFGSCSDHIAWVTLGSAGWPDSTYGDTDKPIRQGMPAFGAVLTDEQIASVSAFERVRFGGKDPDTTLVDCGLMDPGDSEHSNGSEPPGNSEQESASAQGNPFN